ncbi:hypothetical protein XENTR_v10018693 [Xenopus tropicalis]|nr:hypothetical protein XENTR_v10018693 [Xenopus tropicalis]
MNGGPFLENIGYIYLIDGEKLKTKCDGTMLLSISRITHMMRHKSSNSLICSSGILTYHGLKTLPTN